MTQDAQAIQERFNEVKVEIAQKCAEDNDFREALLSDTNGTIEEEYGLEKGALKDMEIVIAPEDNNKIVIAIPGDTSEMELSDDELDQVAGGFAFSVALTVGVIAAGATVAVGTGTIVQNTRAGRSW